MTNLSDAIKQQNFKDSKHKAYLNILYTSNWLRDKFNPIFKEYNILAQHYNVMRIVRGRKGEPVSPGDIIDVMLDKGRDLTRLVDKLVKLDYLERQTCEHNRRKVEIFITDLGLQVTQNIQEKINVIMNNELI